MGNIVMRGVADRPARVACDVLHVVLGQVPAPRQVRMVRVSVRTTGARTSGRQQFHTRLVEVIEFGKTARYVLHTALLVKGLEHVICRRMEKRVGPRLA